MLVCFQPPSLFNPTSACLHASSCGWEQESNAPRQAVSPGAPCPFLQPLQSLVGWAVPPPLPPAMRHGSDAPAQEKILGVLRGMPDPDGDGAASQDGEAGRRHFPS